MKKICLFFLALALPFLQRIEAQCIKDIQNLIEMPTPCFFIGMIDWDNPECFDASGGSNFTYTWKIKSADDGALIATYNGMMFQHSFEKFGGYEFCLEIDKDQDPYNIAEVIDCVTYTTCQICNEEKIDIEYVSCPFGTGCDIKLTTNIKAENAIGLKPIAKFTVTYLPTPQELAGGIESYDLEYDDIDVEYNAQTDTILVSQNITIPYQRGCYIPKVKFKLLDGYGAHGLDGQACTEITLDSEEKFRCIACANEDGECIASELAAEISNTEGTCNMFTLCNQLREDESNENVESHARSFGISPNPATDRLHVDLPNHESDARQLLVINMLGQQVMRMDIPAGESHFDFYIDTLLSGLYLVTVLEEGEIAYSTQLVISR